MAGYAGTPSNYLTHGTPLVRKYTVIYSYLTTNTHLIAQKMRVQDSNQQSVAMLLQQDQSPGRDHLTNDRNSQWEVHQFLLHLIDLLKVANKTVNCLEIGHFSCNIYSYFC